jgi:MFS family permease
MAAGVGFVPLPREPMTLFYGWVIVGVGIVVTCVGFGAMLTLSVFLQPVAEAMGWSRTGIATAALLNFLCMGLGAFMWGAVSDRYGPRIVVLCGGALLGLGMVLASQASTLLKFQLLYGAIVGVASGSFYAPLIATTTKWFTRNRSLAVALVSAGVSVGSTVMAPLARWMITSFDWRTAMWTIGDLVWLVIIPAAFLVRNPAAADTGPAATSAPARTSRSGRWSAPRSSPPSRSHTSRAAQRTRARSSTWSRTRSTAGYPRWPPPPC